MAPHMQSTLEDVQSTLRSLSVHANDSSSAKLPLTRSYYQVPHGRLVHDFIGRDNILARIEVALSSKQARGTHVVVLRGLGGQGKSQIALEYCRRAKEEGVGVIIWVDATSEASVKKGFQTIAEKFKRHDEFVTDTEVADYIVEKLRDWQAPWLMVFDNYDDVVSFNNIRNYLPEGDGGRIIITSRHPSSEDLAHHIVSRIHIEGLSESDALDLLWTTSYFGQKKFRASEIEGAKWIVHKLACHPLAITQAGSFIKQQKIRIEEFMNHYDKKREKILKHTPLLSQYRRNISSETENEISLSVFTTWELSFLPLMDSSNCGKEKADLLTLFAFFNFRDICEDLFAGYCKRAQGSEDHFWPARCLLPCIGSKRPEEKILVKNSLEEKTLAEQNQWDSDSFVRILDDLTQTSLVQAWTRGEDGFCHFSLHSLVRDWIRLRTSEEERQYYSILSGKIITGYLIDNYHQRSFRLKLSKQCALLAHISDYLENTAAFSDNEELDNVDDWIGSFLVRCGRYKEGETVRKRLLNSRQSTLGLQNASTLQAMNHLANIFDRQEKLDLAEELFRRTLKGKQSVLGLEHQGTFKTMADLAWVLYRKGKFAAAEKIAREAVEGQDNNIGKIRQTSFNSLDTLAQILRAQGKYEEAMVYQQRSLLGRQKALGEDHPATLIAAINVGSVFQDLGQYDHAEEYMAKAFKTQKRTLGMEHPDTLLCTNNLALVYRDQGRLKLAEENMEKLVDINKRLLGPSHSYTLKSTANLARILKCQRRFVDALKLYEQVILRLEKTLGPSHPYNVKFSEEFEALRVEMEVGVIGKVLPLGGLRRGHHMSLIILLVFLSLNLLVWYCCW